jgi:F-box protein 9
MCILQHEDSDIEKLLPLYDNDWIKLWTKKPTLRRDGVYISKVSYVRPGLSSESYNQPIHLITYFRYLRFLPHGKCLMITSHLHPKDVVPVFTRKLKGVRSLEWSWINQDSIKMEWVDERKSNLMFCCILKVKCMRNQLWNRISWIDYKTDDLRAGINQDTYHFPQQQLKPFVFSHVKSYRNAFTQAHQMTKLIL